MLVINQLYSFDLIGRRSIFYLNGIEIGCDKNA